MSRAKGFYSWIVPLLSTGGILFLVVWPEVVNPGGSGFFKDINLHTSNIYRLFKGTAMGCCDYLHEIKKRPQFMFLLGIVMAGICKVPLLNNWMSFLHTLQHEMVHLISAGIIGGRPVSMEVVVGKGGTACSSRDNIVVRLSPYVIPLFTAIFLGLAGLFKNDYRFIAVFLAGFFYANFLAKTFCSLKSSQPDVEKSGGTIIALPIILVFNIGVMFAIKRLLQNL